MIIKRMELLGVLKQCLPGVESGNITLEGADTVIFSGGSVFTYNDAVAVRVPITDIGLLEEPLEGAVKAMEFYNVINKLSGEDIKATAADNYWILKCGKAKIEMALILFDYKTRLSYVDPGEGDWVDLPVDFQTGLGLCKMGVNKSSLSGVVFSGDRMLSTDGWQVNRSVLPGAEFPPFWLSDQVVSELLKLSKLKQLSLQGSWAHFKTESGSVFSVKTLQIEKWPIGKVDSLFELNARGEGDVGGSFPKELLPAIDRASFFSEEIDGHETVELTINAKGVSVRAVRSSGRYVEMVPWEGQEGEGLNEEVVISVSSLMMSYASKRTVKFYIHSIEKNGEGMKRLIFFDERSQHLLSTFISKESGKEDTAE